MNQPHELPKNFDPSAFEMKWYHLHEEAGLFRPESAGPDAEPFVIVIPPPNVTGKLHLGHALGRTLEDILCRWRRMQGRAVLWFPGVDHAGIATQMVVERDLFERTGRSRHDVGRAAFLELCRDWAAARRGDILNQIRRLGSSCDFSRDYYTLDEPRSAAVRFAFTTLFHQGLAYRADRMVNWCIRCATVLSDLEVNHVEQSGLLWSIAYPLEDGSGEIVVATTRPETMLGDTAVAVHPEDERFRGLAGKRVALPLTGRSIPVVADPLVDRAFGTGAVKITPAHDPNDFEAARRHGLDTVAVIGFDGKMTADAGGAYAGLDRAEARRKVLRDLETKGLRRGETPHVLPIGRCQRCDTVLEPLVSLQWFVTIGPLAEKAVAATSRGETRFLPELWKKTFDEWMRNIRDWCVSRQLWWGHPIPAFYCPDGHVTVPRPGELDPSACATCGSGTLRQDGDVFDTWFSSWLMPLSVAGWPEKSADYARYYPTSVLVTAFDILFFWVARMIMAGCWFDGRAPFADVVIHGLVRDETGQKMSKTKGNVIDPLEMCDEFGADAVRFALAVQSGTGRDIPFGTSRIAPARAFATKVWNAARFALGMLHEGKPEASAIEYGSLGTVDRWILARLSAAVSKVGAALESYRFDEAAGALYAFFWSEFCDGYVEMVKPVLRDAALPEAEKAKTRAVLHRVLLDSLALLHPFMPFVSCEIRDALAGDGAVLPVTPFPRAEPAWDDPLAVQTVETIRAAATRIRNLKAERGLPQTATLEAGLEAGGPLAASLEMHGPLLVHLARLKSLVVAPKVEIAGAFRDVIGPVGLVVSLPSKEMTVEERRKLEKDLAALEREAAALRRKLGDESFLAKAPAAVVGKSRKQLAELEERGTRLAGNLGARTASAPARSPLGARAPLSGRRFPFLSNLVFFDAVGSTNDIGKEIAEKLLADGTEVPPTVIVAKRQTGGRGRGSRVWISPAETGLTLSLVLPWPEGPERVRLPLRLGIVLARGIGARCGLDVRLKWPNDLVVGRLKVGGILVEARAGPDGEGYAVAGIGLNVRATRETLDAEGLKDATSLAEAGVPLVRLEPENILVTVLEVLDAGLSAPAFALPAAFDEVSAHRPGERLAVAEAGRETSGSYLGVTEDGFLRLRTPDGEETVVSGEIASF
jgi:valyl-tRNA synthetase